ncbi:hypothetical protein ACFFX1_07825 [Dactylosporangium sucinum]|uniref:Uncharacterized protein n=1 Tax=Dactylosporangium sucinum TaxID=1424081 RepID=A0A917U5C7_9ACTN|nr:hypothetical protein [Dactylosporangium sucinum]GGM56091.1 hypothetical protein GCM10007977_067200 [Dactylosporangium sucinum]
MRKWLFAYPRDYRRDELLDTLLEAGRTRLTAREAANLVRHGLRARLGRPASRTVVLWAALTAVICGLFGAAFATRAAWETARPLPSAAQATSMLAEIVPGKHFEGVTDAPSLFVVYGGPLRWSAARVLLLGDGGEYQAATVGGGTPGNADVEATVQRLRDLGWTVYAPVERDLYGCAGPPCDPATIPTSTTLVASRGDTVFTLELTGSYLSASFQRAAPWTVWPAGIAGFLLGAAASFLVFGWASRRRPRTSATLLFAAALFLWWTPTVFAVPLALNHHLGEPHPSWHPLWEWLGQPTFSLLFLLGTAAAVLSLAVSALPSRRRTPARLATAG